MKYKKRLYLQQQYTKDAIKEVAKQIGLNKNIVYQEYNSK